MLIPSTDDETINFLPQAAGIVRKREAAARKGKVQKEEEMDENERLQYKMETKMILISRAFIDLHGRIYELIHVNLIVEKLISLANLGAIHCEVRWASQVMSSHVRAVKRTQLFLSLRASPHHTSQFITTSSIAIILILAHLSSDFPLRRRESYLDQVRASGGHVALLWGVS